MELITIVLWGLPLLVIAYVVLIFQELHAIKSQEDLLPKPEEVEVDISDEAGSFQPTFIDKDAAPKVVSPMPEQQKDEPSADKSVVQPPSGKEEKESKESKKPDANDEVPQNITVPADNAAEPIMADEATRRRIQELVDAKREEMYAEEMAEEEKKSEQKEPDDQQRDSENGKGKKSKSPKPSNSVSPDVKGSDAARKRKRRPIPAFFYYVANVEPQDTVLCGGQTAESLSEEAGRVSADKVAMLAKKIDAEWEESDTEPRELDEDEQIAIEMAKKRNRGRNIPTVNF
ncbi:MAG: hypothetical protein ACI4T9_12780 [Prevotella sp.]